MKIVSYGCTNYKPFKEPTVLELAPLTLIYGKNSAGKSAILRLLRLICRGVTNRSQNELALTVDTVSYGNTFTDLVHGRLPHGAVTFDLKVQNGKHTYDFTTIVQNLHGQIGELTKSRNSTQVAKFEMRSPNSLTLAWAPSPNEYEAYQGYPAVSFRGLWPSADSTLNFSELECAIFFESGRVIERLEQSITHLGPLRRPVEKIYPSGQATSMGFDGAGAAGILARNSKLQEKVGNWYQTYMDGWKLAIAPSGVAFECNLIKHNSTVNLADAGQGMQQVFPIVVQQFLHHVNEMATYVDLIEQPELHLHTAAQAPLGDLFLETAALGKGQLIVETHSENLLLRVRRRIAEGANSSLVALYWIEDHPEGHSTLRRIQIDASGQLDWWREGVFSEGFEEVRAIGRAMQSAAKG
jgi:predicted ATPase